MQLRTESFRVPTHNLCGAKITAFLVVFSSYFDRFGFGQKFQSAVLGRLHFDHTGV
jgi:hypothetical protein